MPVCASTALPGTVPVTFTLCWAELVFTTTAVNASEGSRKSPSLFQSMKPKMRAEVPVLLNTETGIVKLKPRESAGIDVTPSSSSGVPLMSSPVAVAFGRPSDSMS